MILTQPRPHHQSFNTSSSSTNAPPYTLNTLKSYPSLMATKSVIRLREPYYSKSQIQNLTRASTARNLPNNTNTLSNNTNTLSNNTNTTTTTINKLQSLPKLLTQSNKNLLRRPKQWDNIVGKSEYNLPNRFSKNWIIDPLEQVLLKSKNPLPSDELKKYAPTTTTSSNNAKNTPTIYAKHHITAQSLNQVLAAIPKRYTTPIKNIIQQQQQQQQPKQQLLTSSKNLRTPSNSNKPPRNIYINIYSPHGGKQETEAFPPKPIYSNRITYSKSPRLLNSRQSTSSRVQFSRPSVPNPQQYQQAIFQLRPKPILKAPILKLPSNRYSDPGKIYDIPEKLFYHHQQHHHHLPQQQQIPPLEYYNIVDNSVQTEDPKSNTDNLKLIQQILDDLKDFLETHKKKTTHHQQQQSTDIMVDGLKTKRNKLVMENEKKVSNDEEELDRHYSQEFSKRLVDSPIRGGDDLGGVKYADVPKELTKSRIVFDSIEEENEELTQIDEEKNKRLSFIQINGGDVKVLNVAKPYSALIQETFTSIDNNNSGLVEIDDAERVIFGFNTRFGKNLSKEEIRAYCTQLDLDCDEKIDLEQFSSVFMNCAI